MSDTYENLARVHSIKTYWKDRGIFSFSCTVTFEDGGSSCIGHRTLDSPTGDGERVGSVYGCDVILELLKVFDVDDLREIKDRVLYVLTENEVSWGAPVELAGFKTLSCADEKDKQMLLSDILKRHKGTKDD